MLRALTYSGLRVAAPACDVQCPCFQTSSREDDLIGSYIWRLLVLRGRGSYCLGTLFMMSFFLSFQSIASVLKKYTIAMFVSLKFSLCRYLCWNGVREKYCCFTGKYCWSSAIEQGHRLSVGNYTQQVTHPVKVYFTMNSNILIWYKKILIFFIWIWSTQDDFRCILFFAWGEHAVYTVTSVVWSSFNLFIRCNHFILESP
jgi:hypothetical protein